MGGSRIALMLIAVVAIGIFALPSTMSVFGGTHTWYDIAGGGVPCAKCHADKYEELSMSDFHTTFAGGDSSDDCYMCHRADRDIRYAKGGGTPGVDTHAATTIACMACHEYEADIMKGPFAGGFKQPKNSQFTYTGKVSIDDSGTPQKISVISDGDHAVHNAYVQSAVDSNMMEDSNEACIACHTAVPMEIDWTRGYAMRSQSVADSLGDWTVQQLGASGTYAVTTYSDGYGDDASTTEPYVDHDVGSSLPSGGGRADWLDFSSERP